MFSIRSKYLGFPGGSVVRTHLPMQGTQVQTLGSEKIPCASGQHSLSATTTKACTPRAHAPQLRVAPGHCNWRKSECSNKDPAQSKKKSRYLRTESLWYIADINTTL